MLLDAFEDDNGRICAAKAAYTYRPHAPYILYCGGTPGGDPIIAPGSLMVSVPAGLLGDDEHCVPRSYYELLYLNHTIPPPLVPRTGLSFKDFPLMYGTRGMLAIAKEAALGPPIENVWLSGLMDAMD